MDDDTRDGWDERRPFRTQAEANALLPQARAVVDEVIRQLPPGQFDINPGTLFVARQTREEVACFAAALTGIPLHLAPVTFPLAQPFDETVDTIVDALLRWRRGAEPDTEQS